jgi:hypothetical protein
MAKVMDDFIQRGFDYAWKRDDTLTDAAVSKLFDGNFRPSDFRRGEGISYSKAKSDFLKGYKTGRGVLVKLPRTGNPGPSAIPTKWTKATVSRKGGQIQIRMGGR